MSFDDFSDLVEAHLMQEQEWTDQDLEADQASEMDLDTVNLLNKQCIFKEI